MNRTVPSHWFALLIVLFAFLPASFTLDPTLDHDTYWHAAVGRWIVEHKQLPEIEPFSRLGVDQGQRWVAYSWMWELLIYGVLVRWGEGGILVFRVLVCALSVTGLLGFIASQNDRSIRTVIVIGLAAMLMMPLMKERPWHLSILFTTLTLTVVCHARDSGRLRYATWLPMVFLIWANLHIQFVLGGVLLVLALIFPGNISRWYWVQVLAACGLAVLINPYHMQLIGVVWDYATHSAPKQLVQELAPLDLLSPWALGIYALILIVAWHGIRHKPDAFACGFMLLSLLLAFQMRRDLWLVPLAAGLFLRSSEGESLRGYMRWMTMIVFVFLAVHFVGLRHGLRQESETNQFPRGAVQFLQAHGQPGMLFNHFDWGGYLIWHLPGYPVSIDGRTNLYGDRVLKRNFACWDGVDWETCGDLHAAQYVVAPIGLPLTAILKGRNTNWKLIHEDATAAVLERLGQKP